MGEDRSDRPDTPTRRAAGAAAGGPAGAAADSARSGDDQAGSDPPGGDLVLDPGVPEGLGAIVEAALGDLGLAAVRVQRQGGGERSVLEVMVERADGGSVGVDDCARASRELAALIDAADALPGAYTLQVSSPGIERPLTRPADFRRFAGEKARLEMREPIAGRRRFTGRLAGIETDGTILLAASADDGAAEVETEDGAAPVRLPFAGLARARLVVEAAVPPAPRGGKRRGKPAREAGGGKNASRGGSKAGRGTGSGETLAGENDRPEDGAGTR
ncbi:MAG: ribosome maturation factor RimP [Azospirillaceae bacterium]